MKSAELLAGGIDVFIDLVGRAISWITLVLALVMGANVFLRYGFSIGFIWSQELEWHLMVPICLFGMSYALRHGEHVRVDILYAKFPDRAKVVVDLVSALLCSRSRSSLSGYRFTTSSSPTSSVSSPRTPVDCPTASC